MDPESANLYVFLFIGQRLSCPLWLVDVFFTAHILSDILLIFFNCSYTNFSPFFEGFMYF